MIEKQMASCNQSLSAPSSCASFRILRSEIRCHGGTLFHTGIISECVKCRILRAITTKFDTHQCHFLEALTRLGLILNDQRHLNHTPCVRQTVFYSSACCSR